MHEYRELVVKEVIHFKDRVDLSFHNCITSFQASNQWFKDRYVNPKDLVSGRHVLIKGRRGNDDVMLASPDALENLVVMPVID